MPVGAAAAPTGESDPLPRGVIVPNSPHRAWVTKAGRGRGARHKASEEVEKKTLAARRAAMRCAQRLKRVFQIDIVTCPACGGAVRIIASLEDPAVIGKILAHLQQVAPGHGVVRLPGPRAAGRVGLTGQAGIHGFTYLGCRPGRQAGWAAASR